MMNNDEQFEEYEFSFHTFLFKNEHNKEFKKTDIKG